MMVVDPNYRKQLALSHAQSEQRSFGLQANLSGQRITYDQQLDEPERLTDALTFLKLTALLKEGDEGEISTLVQLWNEMQAKDSRLRAVVQTRVNALTGIEWEIIPNSKAPKKDALAIAAANFVREELDRMDTFVPALRTMAKGIPVNIAVLEKIWQGVRLDRIIAVPHSRYVVDYTRSPHMRLRDSVGDQGFVPDPNKFVVHVPDPSGSNPWCNTIAISQAVLWKAKKEAWVGWIYFAEVYGTPFRLGKLAKDASPSDRTAMAKALKEMGSQAWGIINEGDAVEFIESSSRSDNPYGPIIEAVNRDQSIGLIGSNLPTDTTGGTGTFAAANVQNLIRVDLLRNDAKAEKFTVETQIIAPMVALRFPGQRVPVPEYNRKIIDDLDVPANVSALDGASRIGLNITQGEAYRMLGITPPDNINTNEILKPPEQTASGGGFNFPGR